MVIAAGLCKGEAKEKEKKKRENYIFNTLLSRCTASCQIARASIP